MRSIDILGGFVLVSAVAGCASTPAAPPQDLVAARATYERASRGPAAQIDPADLHTARNTLAAAEQSFRDDGDTQDTRDLAYTADRQAQAAEATARTMQTIQQRDQVVAQMNASTLAALGRTNMQVASQQGELQSEALRRQDAEKRAAQASAFLVHVASVSCEPRGIVITLSGNVLFPTGKADLLAGAQAKLDDVAKELTRQDPVSKIVVEGHTDSQGRAPLNQDLSQRRADTVRDYLVSHGIAAERVTAQGFGATQPVGDNATPDGRASNRRVEVVIQPPK
jgi:outer membrane protein OmpA-like peptidoglycan-associated protein